MTNQSKEKKSQIAKAYLSRKYFACNIYFPRFADTPEELRGKVFWVSLPQTIYDKCESCLFKDDGGSEIDPQAFGNFYNLNNGYVLQVTIKPKGGGSFTFNDYSETKFLPQTKGPIAKTEEEIAEIFAQAHDIPSKFAARDYNALKAEVDKILNKDSAGSGFSDDRTQSSPAATKTAPKATELEELPAETKSTPSTPSTPKSTPKSEAKHPEQLEELPRETVSSGSKKEKGNSVDDAELANLLDEIKGGGKS